MEYLKINGVDYSQYVNSLKITKIAIFNTQTNAAGDSVVDYVNSKRQITVGIIPLDNTTMAQLQAAIDAFNVSLTILNPITNDLEIINCIIPEHDVEYYTIRVDKVMYKTFILTFTEL